MQRFLPSDLDQLEQYLLNIGFKITSRKIDERDGKPPLAVLEASGKGDLQAVHTNLARSPFLVTGFDSKLHPNGLSVRLKLSQREVREQGETEASPEFGDLEQYGVYKFEPEMGE